MNPIRVAVACLFGIACRGDRQPGTHVQSAGAVPTTITGEAVGPVRIGLTRDSLRRVAEVIREVTELDDEANPQDVAYVVFGRDTVAVELSERRVWRVRITSAGPETVDGLRVGTRLTRLLTSNAVFGALGEGKVYVLDRRRCGVSFGLSPEAITLRAELDSAALARLPGTTRVDEILVVGCSRAAS